MSGTILEKKDMDSIITGYEARQLITSSTLSPDPYMDSAKKDNASTLKTGEEDNAPTTKIGKELQRFTHQVLRQGFYISPEMIREWPEVAALHNKIISKEELDKHDKLWISEIAEATGWDEEDVIEEVMNLGADPSERVKNYKTLYEKYLREASNLKEKGELEQAGEKLWGATVALIKYYASIKGLFISHWSRSKLDSFITSNVEQQYREMFRAALDKAQAFHEYFYEGVPDKRTFEERWSDTIKHIEQLLKKIER